MTKRPFTPAAGLVLFYVAFLQCGFALDIAMSSLESTFAWNVFIPAISLLLVQVGQLGMGFAAARNMSLHVGASLWLVGGLGTAYGLSRLGASPGDIAVGLLQLLGGPGILAVATRFSPASRTPLRRELGALLLVMAVGNVLGSLWHAVWVLERFGPTSLTVGSLASLSIDPAVALVVSAFAWRAGRLLMNGHDAAVKSVVVWQWIAIVASVAMSILTVISFARLDHEIPRVMMLAPLVHAAFSSLLPLAVVRIARGACKEPVAARDASTTPSIYAWSALWLVPVFLLAAVLMRVTVIGALVHVFGSHTTSSDLSLIAFVCGAVAVLLLATGLTSLRGLPIAKWLAGLTATLSTVGLVGCVYLALPSDAGMGLPVGLVALFTVAMIALAHFENRRELDHDLAPARVI